MQRLQNFTATVIQAAVVPCRVGNNVINRRRNKNNNPISNNYGRIHNVQLLYSTTTTTIKNPFRVLGLPSFTSFSIVQKKFLKLAMKHHPDTKCADNNDTGNTGTGTGTGTGSAPNSVNDDFVRIRTAYEQIRKEHNRRQLRERSTTFTRPTSRTRTSQNTATDRNNNNYNNNDTNNTTDYSDSSSFTFTSEEENEFLEWFYDMSKVRITSMQRQEMVAVYWKQARLHEHYPGGQFWDFARRLVTFQDAFLQNREKNNKNNRNESKTTTTKKTTNKMKENINIRRKRHPRGR